MQTQTHTHSHKQTNRQDRLQYTAPQLNTVIVSGNSAGFSTKQWRSIFIHMPRITKHLRLQTAEHTKSQWRW